MADTNERSKKRIKTEEYSQQGYDGQQFQDADTQRVLDEIRANILEKQRLVINAHRQRIEASKYREEV